MRLAEILNESVTFGIGRLTDWGEGRMGYSDPFEKKVTKPCWVCNGTGFEKYGGYTHPDTGENVPEYKETCGMCKGKKEIEEWESTAGELNVANGNAFAICEMMGVEPDYSGAIKKEQFPEIRRRLIRLKNGDISPHVQDPTKEVGKMRAYKDDTGQTSIGRGATVYDSGRSHSQVERYIDKLLSMMDFAQKNDCDLTWG